MSKQTWQQRSARRTAPTRTKMDEIASLLEDAITTNDRAQFARCGKAMQDFKQQQWRSYAGLRRIPGFRKLWDAIEEACANVG